MVIDSVTIGALMFSLVSLWSLKTSICNLNEEKIKKRYRIIVLPLVSLLCCIAISVVSILGYLKIN